MDISACDFCGESISWHSHTGEVASPHFDPQGLNWLRSFYGGLLMTCGMSWAGAPCVDPSETGPEGYPAPAADGSWDQVGGVGLHGRVSHIPAKNVYVDSQWDGDTLRFSRSGVKGSIAVSAAAVEVHAELGLMLSPLKGMVEDEIRRKLAEQFA